MFTAQSAMRSKSLLALMIVVIIRKSPAAGWCRASRSIAPFSTLTSSSSTFASPSMTCCASLASSATSDSIDSSTDCCTDAPMRERRLFKSARRSVKRWDTAVLSKSAGDVIFGLFLPGVRKNRRRLVVFDERAKVEERRVIAHPRGLLHVVGDDHNGVARLELVD